MILQRVLEYSRKEIKVAHLIISDRPKAKGACLRTTDAC